MWPTAFLSSDPEEDRRRYKCVQTDTLTDVGPPGALILSASVEKGECELSWVVRGMDKNSDTTKTEKFTLVPNGLRIIPR